MAYPEPIEPLKGKAARKFMERLDSFKLSASQRRLFRGAKKSYETSQKGKGNDKA
jgi:hypothetical protein